MPGRCVKNILLGLLWIAATCHAEVVVVTSANSMLGVLSREQVVNVFLGKSRMVGGLAVKALDINASALQTEFYSFVIGMSEDQYRAYWSRLVFTGKAFPPAEVANIKEAQKRLVANPALITYFPFEAVDASLKIIYRGEK